MRHSQYTAIGRDLARTHVDIQHNPDPEAQECRFVRILISSDPVQKQLDLSEFYGSLRSRLFLGDYLALVLENYQSDYSDNQGDFYAKWHHGAFMVLGLPEKDDYDARDAVIDRSERVGEELMATWIFRLRELGLHITPDDVMQEAIGPVAGLVGCRFNFSFRSGATAALTHNPEKYLS